ncbi:sensor histidine kinase [Flavobacterium sp. 3HN19-14]|uniref:sensor histidine kinase n=1 Tax=Flavobacterium sp. 3HN19-14 TaxID=3448133 RepID=UPI003EE1EFEA
MSDSGKEYFRRMRNAAERMQTLINDLLSYSRTNNQKQKFELTDLNSILEEVKADLSEELLQQNAVIEVGNLNTVRIIPFQFRQILYNLFSNSIKFVAAGTAPHIMINSEIDLGKNLSHPQLLPDQDYCHIRISDNGIGFESAYNEKIFELFQRLHGRETYEGTGLGLAIVKKIVENHHGFITADGESGGAKFDIYIPA